MNFTGQLFTPTPPTSYIGRFSVSPEQLPYISEHTTFLFAELDAHNSGFTMLTVSAPAGVMPLKSDAFGKKRVRPSEAYYAALHTLPKGD